MELSVRRTTPESITVKNVSPATVDLSGYLVKLHLSGASDKFIFGHPIEAGTLLAPGEGLTVWMDRAPDGDARLTRSLNRGTTSSPTAATPSACARPPTCRSPAPPGAARAAAHARQGAASTGLASFGERL